MQWYWQIEPDKRFSFSTLVNTLSKSLEKQAGYLHVGAFTIDDDHNSSTGHNCTCASSNEELPSQQ